MKTDISCKIVGEISMTLTEVEARALVELAKYGEDNFLKCFYENLGTYGLKPFEKGVRSILKHASGPLSHQISRIDTARKAFCESANQSVQATASRRHS